MSRVNEPVYILDRFHLMLHFNTAIAEIGVKEACHLKRDVYVSLLKLSEFTKNNL